MGYVHHEPGDEPSGSGSSGFQPTPHQIASAVVIAIVVILALVNLDKVSIDFVVASVEIPLVFVILGSMGIGIAAGALIRHHQRKLDES